jgi:hypothetical protein
VVPAAIEPPERVKVPALLEGDSLAATHEYTEHTPDVVVVQPGASDAGLKLAEKSNCGEAPHVPPRHCWNKMLPESVPPDPEPPPLPEPELPPLPDPEPPDPELPPLLDPEPPPLLDPELPPPLLDPEPPMMMPELLPPPEPDPPLLAPELLLPPEPELEDALASG